MSSVNKLIKRWKDECGLAVYQEIAVMVPIDVYKRAMGLAVAVTPQELYEHYKRVDKALAEAYEPTEEENQAHCEAMAAFKADKQKGQAGRVAMKQLKKYYQEFAELKLDLFDAKMGEQAAREEQINAAIMFCYRKIKNTEKYLVDIGVSRDYWSPDAGVEAIEDANRRRQEELGQMKMGLGMLPTRREE